MGKKLSRRELAVSAAGLAAFGQEETPPAKLYDPVAWTREQYTGAPLAMTFRATNRRSAEAWQKRLRAKIAELIGGFPTTQTPLKAERLDMREYPGYTREKLLFESRPGLPVIAYLLAPKEAKTPHPTVVCVPGHGRGVDDIVGIDEQGRDRTGKPGYQHDFAIQVVEQGVAAVAIEPLGFGCRRDPINAKRSRTQSACQPVAGAALLFGQSMIGWRVYDVMRTIDWIATRPELDSKRVGCMGISGGGTCTLFSAAMEPRIRAAFVSGYLNTFRDSILSLSHCIDNYVPGILNWCEMYDVAGCIAPRPICFESGKRDRIFPIAAARASFDRVKQMYAAFGAADRTSHEVFDDEHVFHGVEGIPFLVRHLRALPA